MRKYEKPAFYTTVAGSVALLLESIADYALAPVYAANTEQLAGIVVDPTIIQIFAVSAFVLGVAFLVFLRIEKDALRKWHFGLICGLSITGLIFTPALYSFFILLVGTILGLFAVKK